MIPESCFVATPTRQAYTETQTLALNTHTGTHACSRATFNVHNLYYILLWLFFCSVLLHNFYLLRFFLCRSSSFGPCSLCYYCRLMCKVTTCVIVHSLVSDFDYRLCICALCSLCFCECVCERTYIYICMPHILRVSFCYRTIEFKCSSLLFRNMGKKCRSKSSAQNGLYALCTEQYIIFVRTFVVGYNSVSVCVRALLISLLLVLLLSAHSFSFLLA